MSAIILTDLGFGDSGKGAWTDALVRHTRARLVVRHCGGAQAGHEVVLPSGQAHTFHQFGSGTLAGAATLLSAKMLCNPLALAEEEQQLRRLGVSEPLARLHLDRRALLTTPFHLAANRLREYARGDGRHGSCGLGIGETMADALAHGRAVPRAADLAHPTVLGRKLLWHQTLKREELQPQLAAVRGHPLPVGVQQAVELLSSEAERLAVVEELAALGTRLNLVGADFLPAWLADGTVIFEGAQGVLLDEWRGFHPHTTWATTTPTNALALLAEAGYHGEVHSLGLIRAYATRHGAGPLPTESAALTAALPDPANPANPWQGAFRVGWLDLPLLRYALAATGPLDGLLVSHLDQLPAEPQVAVEYRLGPDRYELPLGPMGNLDHTQALGERLRQVQPVYQPVTECFEQWVARRLGHPLWGVARGRTAAERVVLAPVTA